MSMLLKKDKRLNRWKNERMEPFCEQSEQNVSRAGLSERLARTE